MELYDADGDGFLSRAELAKCPGILQALELYDTNDDKQVDQQEIHSRLQKYVDTGPAYMGWSCVVLMDGQPLREAEVKFIPEPFLADAIQPAYGVTDRSGRAEMAVDPSEAPPGLQAGYGMRPGIYKIEVQHAAMPIPPRYNTESELGAEVSPIELQAPQETTVRLTRR